MKKWIAYLLSILVYTTLLNCTDSNSESNVKLIKTGINSYELLVQPGTYKFELKIK
jgi:hypothetical protein